MQVQESPAWKRHKAFVYFEKAISVIETILNVIGACLIMVIMFLAVTEVGGRYFFNYPIPGHLEIVELIMAAIVFLGVSYTQGIGGHIRMEIFINTVAKGRFYHIIEALNILLPLLVFGVIAINSFEFALDAYLMGDITAHIHWYTWPSKMCVPLGVGLLCIRFVIQLLQHILQTASGAEMRSLD
jgi:TRAP-type C4-dicarboxylate transport system permease small subunit